MAERYTKIFSLKNGICEKGLPIKINAGALLRDNATGKLLVQLKIQNAQKKTLTLVRVKILQGREQAALDFEYKDLSVAENGEFGVQTPIFLTSEKAKTFSVTVTGVKFEDGTVWIPAKALKQAPTGTVRQTKPTPVSAPVKNPSPSRAPAEAAEKTSPAPDENKIKENDLLYNSAIELAHSGNIDSIKKAIKQFEAVRGWKDADKYILACRKKIAELEEQARAASMTRAKAEAKAKAEAEVKAKAEVKTKAEAKVKSKAETETKADSENSETKPKKKRKKIIFGLLLLGIVLGIIAVIFATCNRTIDVTEISLNNQSISLDVGESVDLTVKVSPNDATDKSVTWKSSNTRVATVSSTGKVTAVGAGSATITVTASNGKTATCEVTVSVKPTEVLLNVNDLTLEKDGSYTFIATVLPDNATNKNVTWKSSNTDVVTVSEGKATAVGTGSATITVTTSNGKTATCTVIVTNSIDDFKYENNNTGYTITGVKNKNKTSYVIPDSVTSIGSYAFSGCSGLTSITIPNSVTSIGSYAFYGCSGLTSITIPNSVTSIDDYAFYGCSGLTSIIIPDGVTSIGSGAFSRCSNLTSVTIPDSVTSIGRYAFDGCSSLTSVTIPDSVTSIGYGVFWGCSKLTSVTIPDSVTSIGNYAFYGCSSLISVTIPDSVTSIGGSAFWRCSSLTSINFQGTKVQWRKITLGSGWKNDSAITKVICTDGTINID